MLKSIKAFIAKRTAKVSPEPWSEPKPRADSYYKFVLSLLDKVSNSETPVLESQNFLSEKAFIAKRTAKVSPKPKPEADSYYNYVLALLDELSNSETPVSESQSFLSDNILSDFEPSLTPRNLLAEFNLVSDSEISSSVSDSDLQSLDNFGSEQDKQALDLHLDAEFHFKLFSEIAYIDPNPELPEAGSELDLFQDCDYDSEEVELEEPISPTPSPEDELELKKLVYDRIVQTAALIKKIAACEENPSRQLYVNSYYGERLGNILTVLLSDVSHSKLKRENKTLIFPFFSHLQQVHSIKEKEKVGYITPTFREYTTRTHKNDPFFVQFPSFAYFKSEESTPELDIYEPVVFRISS